MKTKITLVIASVFLLLSIIQCSPGDNKKAIDSKKSAKMLRYAQTALEQKKFKRALKLITQVAEAGHPKGQIELGRLYAEGIGVPQNLERGFYWTSMAAQQEDSEAQKLLAYYYQFGKGQAVNPALAFYWHSKAAIQGDADSQTELGHLYYQGVGTKKNLKEAVKWFEKSAKHGHSSGQFAYGRELIKVDGTADEGFKWIGKSIAQGNADAMYLLGESHENGTYSKKVDFIKARQYYTQAANKGHKKAQHRLASFMEEGKGGGQDEISAYIWYSRSGKIAQRSLRLLKKQMSAEDIQAAEKRLQE